MCVCTWECYYIFCKLIIYSGQLNISHSSYNIGIKFKSLKNCHQKFLFAHITDYLKIPWQMIVSIVELPDLMHFEELAINACQHQLQQKLHIFISMNLSFLYLIQRTANRIALIWLLIAYLLLGLWEKEPHMTSVAAAFLCWLEEVVLSVCNL